ncbi:FtsX-like permease family protein [Spirillospora sp. NPDC049652]
MSAPALRSIRTRLPALLALAVLVMLTTGLAVAVPARVVHGFDRSAAQAAGPDGAVSVTGTARGSTAFGKIPAPDALVGQGVGWRALLPPELSRATQEPDPFAYVGPDMVQRPRWKRPGFLRLFVNPSLKSPHVRFLSGDPDREDDGMPGGPGIYVTQKTADLFELKVGSPVRVENPAGELVLHVAGIIEALDPGSSYWTARQAVTKPWVYVEAKSGRERQFGGALMGPKGYSALRALGAGVNYTWRFPLRQDRVTAASLRAMGPELDQFRAAVSGRSDSVPSEVQTPLDGRIKEFTSQYATAQVITGLVFGGLAAVLAGSVLTGLVLFAERLRGTLATMRARGASRAQLFGTVSWLTVPVLLPAVALGFGLGHLVHAGPLQLSSVYLVLAIAVAVVVVPWAAAVGWRRGSVGTSPRPEVAAVRPSKRRVVVEGLAVVLAVAATLVMRRRGLAVQSELGADPLISAVPVLLGAGVGLLVLRVLPWPLRYAGRLLGRRRSAVGFVGLARASRRQVLTLLPTIVLLLAAAVAGFGSTVDAALVRGQRTAAWHTVGSDVRITAGRLDPRLPERLASVRGVTGAVPLRMVPEAVVGAPAGQPGPRVIVVAVDIAAYKRIAGGAARFIPDAPGAPDGVLASPSAAASLGTRPTTLAWMGGPRLTVRPSGIVRDFPALDSADRYVIIPYRLLQAFPTSAPQAFPTQVFVQGHGIDRAALERIARSSEPDAAEAPVGEGFIRYHDDVERAMTRSPMARVVHRAFAESALLVAGYGLLTVLFTLLVGARERGRAIAHLEVLGLGRRQRRLLAITEAGPAIVSAVAAGWLLGFLLPRVTGPMLDLRPYTSGFAVTDHAVDLLHLAAFAGALPAVALAAVLVDRIFDARHRLGEVLRTGEET